MRAPVVTRITPLQAIEGGRIAIDGEGFTVDGPELPEVRIGNAVMRVVYASPSRLSAIVPAGLDAGRVPVRIAGVAGATAYIDVAAPFAAGLHQVDSPVFDRAGNLYVTFSGTRGQQVPVSIFRVTPNGTRETFSSGIVNPTSMAIDHHDRLYVSSRFEGTLYRVDPDGTVSTRYAAFGRPQGLAFDPAGTLFVVEALAGSSGLYRVPPTGDPELVLAGSGLVGVAFDSHGVVVVASNETAYRLPPAKSA
jgi:DNA-binding beta-propeller fold protein YncE